ncbi:Uncharacterized protein TCM_017750 [Theobroma cacao]|uniref:Putative plant transposon protein domain-containing protein n=1 Tax=Theobroma cacao TaxID=3641 RepID=A0A061EF11_THECC|nr:Uncharacterized protein TCM_017750 [Theobroma cacao]
MAIVHEFYANFAEHDNGRIFIRGRQVPFDTLTINQFYNTPNIENDEYSQFVNGDINLDEVLGYLILLGIE